MGEMWHNTGVNHIKSSRALERTCYPFSTRVRGTDTMTHSNSQPTEQSNIPYGYCHCGCGQKTTIVVCSDKKHGRIKGEPHHFLRGHNARGLCRETVIGAADCHWREILLTQGQVAIVDAADYEWLSKFNWFANPTGDGWYATRKVWSAEGGVTVMMHRAIMCPADGQEVDHINGDRLDNRRSNLRLATRTQNGQNRRKPKNNKSGYKGVHQNRRKWRARIKVGGVNMSLGTYETVEEAAAIYNEAAKKYYGEYARLNILEEFSTEEDK